MNHSLMEPIPRRCFIKKMAMGVGLIGLSPFLTSCITRPKRLLSDEGNSQSMNVCQLDNDLKNVLHLSSLAPSSHNTQPWGVIAENKDQWIIQSEKKRWLPFVDQENRETLLSIGAFFENLTIAAASYGYTAHHDVIAKNHMSEKILRIDMKRGTKKSGDNERIKRRRTLRKGFSTEAIKKNDIAFLNAESKGEVEFIPFQSLVGKTINEMTIEANRAQVSRDEIQRELAQWIRWKPSKAPHYQNGLTPETMEIGGIAGWYVRTFFNDKTVLSQSFRDKTVEAVVKQVQNHGGWLLITSRNSQVKELINAGRLYERICLNALERNIAVHPMSQILEEEPFKNEIKTAAGIQEDIQFILRLGYVNMYPRPVSPRIPVNLFTSCG